ncbi:MAG: GspE/PulE family protein [Candidatus Xenobiia bacterium LiM19]
MKSDYTVTKSSSDNLKDKMTKMIPGTFLGGKKREISKMDLPAYLQFLINEGHISIDELKPYIKSNKLQYALLEPHLLESVGKVRLLEALSEDYGVPAIDLENDNISPHIGKMIPKEVGENNLVCSVNLDENGITLAMVDPRNENAIQQVESKTDFRVVARKVALFSDIVGYQELLYGTPRGLPLSPRDLVDDIIKKAIEQGASDIHIEPLEDDIKVRFRKDGILLESYDICEIALKDMIHKKLIIRHLKNSIPVVVKNKSGASGVTMKIEETQKPQDGRIFLPSRRLDMRISIIPTVYGESIVIRILNPQTEGTDFMSLGFSNRDSSRFKKVIEAPYGLVFVSGPTGSGKSTTLYTVLRHLQDPTKKILTVEDPVEYTIQGIMQVQTNPAKDVTFAETLRSFLRHDPDIIMVGEIRDRETAAMAIEASLTGHLVLSTIHANDAVKTIIRIKDLGINPLLITSTCLATMAQRLVRVNCPYCKQRATFSPRFHRLMDYFGLSYRKEDLVKSNGCPRCNGTGYRGRTGIYELMLMTQQMQELILQNATDIEMERLARAQGMRLLIEDALQKSAQGITTEEEILRVTLADYGDRMDTPPMQGKKRKTLHPVTGESEITSYSSEEYDEIDTDEVTVVRDVVDDSPDEWDVREKNITEQEAESSVEEYLHPHSTTNGEPVAPLEENEVEAESSKEPSSRVSLVSALPSEEFSHWVLQVQCNGEWRSI